MVKGLPTWPIDILLHIDSWFLGIDAIKNYISAHFVVVICVSFGGMLFALRLGSLLCGRGRGFSLVP